MARWRVTETIWLPMPETFTIHPSQEISAHYNFRPHTPWACSELFQILFSSSSDTMVGLVLPLFFHLPTDGVTLLEFQHQMHSLASDNDHSTQNLLKTNFCTLYKRKTITVYLCWAYFTWHKDIYFHPYVTDNVAGSTTTLFYTWRN